MAVQNKTTYQANVDSLITTNGVGDISGADVNSVLDNLSDSAPLRKTKVSLGVDPTTWNVNSFERAVDSCQLNSSGTIAISNTVDQGVYLLAVRKVAATITLSFTESGNTFYYDNGDSQLTLGSTGAITEVIVKLVRVGTDIYVSCSMSDILDEDDFASDSNRKAPSQQSVKAYVNANGGFAYKDDATVDPTTTNDINDTTNASNGIGFVIGSFWLNTTTGVLWVCKDNTNSAAVWSIMAQPTATGTTVTHSSDGTRTIDFADADYITLELDANVTTLTFSNLPLRKPVYLRIEQNASTGYTITTITNLDNPDDVFPDYSTTANEHSRWEITAITSSLIKVVGEGNVA